MIVGVQNFGLNFPGDIECPISGVSNYACYSTCPPDLDDLTTPFKIEKGELEECSSTVSKDFLVDSPCSTRIVARKPR
jgi:hypothetical protein